MKILRMMGTALFLVMTLVHCGRDQGENKGARDATPESLDGRRFDDDEFLCSPPQAALTQDSPATGTSTVTYESEIKGLLQGKCTACHTAGATAPDLTSYALAKENADQSLAAVQDGSMPPGGKLSDAEIALFSAWKDAGLPETSVQPPTFDPAKPDDTPKPDDGAGDKQAPPAGGGISTPNCGQLPDPASGGSGAGQGSGSGSGAGSGDGAGAGSEEGPGTGSGEGSGEASGDGSGDAQLAVTWEKDIEALMTRECISCHQPGATAPDLTTYAGASAEALASLERIENGTMPPAGPLDETDKAVFKAWIDGGKLEKSPSTEAAAGEGT